MKPEYDTERISAIISDIGRYRNDLLDLSITSPADLHDKRTFYAASMILFAILNRTIDLGNEIIIAHGFGVPTTYRDIFTILEKENMTERDLAKKSPDSFSTGTCSPTNIMVLIRKRSSS